MPHLLSVFSRSVLCLVLTAALLAPAALAQDRSVPRRAGLSDRAVPPALRAEVDAAVAAAGTPLGSGLAEAVTAAFAQEARLTASDGQDGGFGLTVSLSGDRALVGAKWASCADGSEGCGSVYVFAFDGSAWSQEQELGALDPEAYAFFGGSLSLSGTRALIGAPGYGSAGWAYVFALDASQPPGSQWFVQAILTAFDAEFADTFGSSVSLSGDRALVGNPGDDCGGEESCGTAYVFAFDASQPFPFQWSLEQKIGSLDGQAGDFFGGSVSLVGDRALVGAALDDCDDGENCGSAYVFSFYSALPEANRWVQEVKLITTDTKAGDRYGDSVSLSGDRALVGASEDDCADGADPNKIFIIHHNM